MKTNPLLVVIIAILFTACAPGTPPQAIEATNPVPTFTKVAPTQEVVVTEEPTATQVPTIAPTPTSHSCVALLTPPDNAELPAMGKVTFSWEPMNEAISYALDILLPSGETVSFETQQTFREQYVEALWAAGEYQWRVIAQDRKRSEICSSEFATFSKPASPQPQQTREDDKKKK